MPKYSIQLITATTAEWATSNYVIPLGELVAEERPSGSIPPFQLKMGDGVNTFKDLPYIGVQGTPGHSPAVTASKSGITTKISVDGVEIASINDGADGQGFVVKGTYSTLTALKSAVPSPSVGDAYAVGSSSPYAIYLYDGVNSTWKNVGSLSNASNSITINGNVVQPSNGTYNLGSFIASTEKGAINGVASLGANGKVPSTQLDLTSKEAKGKITINNAEYTVRTSTTDEGEDGYITFVLA